MNDDGLISRARPREEEQLLATPEAEHVGTLARRGAAWAVGLAVSNQAINIVSTMFLSRLLLPSDYGTMGMVATFTSLLAAMSGMGLSWATIQRREVTLRQVHNLFWINTAVGVAFWLLCTMAAGPIARFYAEPAIESVTPVYGATFLLVGVAVQPMALLQRRLAFGITTRIELGANIVGSVVSIVVAFMGMGYWALVWGPIAYQLCRTTMAFGVGGYKPRLPRRDPETLGMVSFGGFLVLSTIVYYLSNNIGNILIGRQWGSEELGYYTRAFFLMTVPTLLLSSGLGQVMIPSLSVLAGDRERMAHGYRRAVAALGFIGFPLAVGLTVAAPEAIRLVYGPRWEPVVPILAWLSVAMVTRVVTNTDGWLYTASGHGRARFFTSVFITVVVLLGALVGVREGATGVAAAFAFVSIGTALPMAWVAHRVAGIALSPTLRVVWPSLALALAMGACSALAGEVVSHSGGGWVATLLTKLVTGGLVYAFGSLVWLAPYPIPVLERARQQSLWIARTSGRRMKWSVRGK